MINDLKDAFFTYAPRLALLLVIIGIISMIAIDEVMGQAISMIGCTILFTWFLYFTGLVMEWWKP